VPSYATGECSDITQYWNACQCFGITPSTVTLPAGATVAAAAPTCTRGLEWAIYPGTEGGWGTGPLSIAALVGGKTPFRTGRTTTFGGFGASGGAAVSPYDMGGNPYFGVEYTIVAHRGYLAPQFEGWYEFVIDTADDFLGFWLGDAAVDGFSTANLVKRWDFPTYQSYYIVVTADMVGKYIPIRLLWANNGGPGSLQGRLLAHPQGVLVLGSAPGSTPNLHIISSKSRPGVRSRVTVFGSGAKLAKVVREPISRLRGSRGRMRLPPDGLSRRGCCVSAVRCAKTIAGGMPWLTTQLGEG